MAIPITYNIRSILVRWTSTVVALLSIAGTVGVFIVVLAMAQGFRATLVSSGSEQNAIVLRAGAGSEMESAIMLDQVKVIGDAAGIATLEDGRPIMSPEVVVVANFPLRGTTLDANVQVRGTSPVVLDVRKKIEIVEGRDEILPHRP